jgi:tetratricopeptide (TPR) repeat protein
MTDIEDFSTPQNHSSFASDKGSSQVDRQAFKQLTKIRRILWPSSESREASLPNGDPKACLSSLAEFEQDYRQLLSDNSDLNRAYGELCGYCYHALRQYHQAANAFADAGNFCMAGKMHLASGHVPNAIDAFTTSQQEISTGTQHGRRGSECRPVPWGTVLVGLISGRLNVLPSVLQIRQHCEADMALLYEAGQQQFLNTLAGYTDFLAQVNPEGYKLMGRSVMNANVLISQALQHPPSVVGQWLLAAQKQQPQDPEIYYHLGQWYAMTGQYHSARRALRQCLMMSPIYPPAEALLASMVLSGKGEVG